MICPSCQEDDDQVINSDHSTDRREVVRRHRCCACGQRWTTRELDARRLQSPIPPTKRRVASAKPEGDAK